MKIDCEAQKEEFLRVARANIRREGLEELLDWLEREDFYEAPASTKYHGAYPGGLCQHALDVFDMALKTAAAFAPELSRESLTVCALFHDLCKVDFYKLGWRTVKVNGKSDQVPAYTIEERFMFGGHGSKSAFLVERHMHLTDEEAMAITCHMGFADGDERTRRTVSDVYKTCPLAWVIHTADEAAAFLLERNEAQ